MGLIDPEEDILEYLKSKQREIIDRIEMLSKSSDPKDSVKLKANQILLNKLVADKTRHEVDFRGSPYDMIKEILEGGKAKEKPGG